MKIAMIVRSTLYKVPGGDSIQITNTANELRRLNVDVEIKFCDEEVNYSKYDLVHFFNVIRPADILRHSESSIIPYVVSPIFVDYSEYERKARSGMVGMVSRLLTSGQQEYLKVLARRVLNGEKISSLSYLLNGHKNSVKHILKNAAMLLPNSNSEYRRLLDAYGVQKEFRVITHAVDEEIFKFSPQQKDKDLVLCVGRIEGLKNQLNLIRALNDTRFKLLIIGSSSPNHKFYYDQCRKEASGNIEFIARVEQHKLAEFYSRAIVHVLPSWFETAGLSSFEAAAMGCNIVITEKGDTKESFGDAAFYAEPDNIASIRDAVEGASASPPNEALRFKIISSCTWKIAAYQTKEAYQEVLNNA